MKGPQFQVRNQGGCQQPATNLKNEYFKKHPLAVEQVRSDSYRTCMFLFCLRPYMEIVHDGCTDGLLSIASSVWARSCSHCASTVIANHAGEPMSRHENGEFSPRGQPLMELQSSSSSHCGSHKMLRPRLERRCSHTQASHHKI